MLGAVVGDIAGSRFEWAPFKAKNFTLFTEKNHFTDDTVMTVAVADAILESNGDLVRLGMLTEASLRVFGNRYPDAGYGGKFCQWLHDTNGEPYNSWGNGSAMRVSPCGWAGRNMDEVLKMAEATAEVTHNHPEGVKGAMAVAACIYLAKNGATKEEIAAHIREKYYFIDFTLDEIRRDYRFDVSCMGSVPQAIRAFLEGEDFEDVIRCAVSIGGDSDTIAAMAGSIAEAYYGVPAALREKAMEYLEEDMKDVICRFETAYGAK